MKRFFLLVALVYLMATLSYAQGTVEFRNGNLTRVTAVNPGVSTVVIPTWAGFINYGLFWGTSPDALTLVPILGVNSTTSAGLISVANPFPIPGSTEGQSVFLQVKGWDASFGFDWKTAWLSGSWFGETRVIQTTLGSVYGPGTVLWQSTSGTADDRFFPLELSTFPPRSLPEPTSFALAGLGAAALLIFRRRN